MHTGVVTRHLLRRKARRVEQLLERSLGPQDAGSPGWKYPTWSGGHVKVVKADADEAGRWLVVNT